MKRNAARPSARDRRLALVLVATLAVAPGAMAAAQERSSGAAADPATGGFVSAGDRCLVDSARAVDARTTVKVRGELCDGRPFVKALLAGLTGNRGAASALDADFDVKVGALAGFNGTELHDVELSVAASADGLREFALTAKPGPDTRLTGRLPPRSDGRQVMALETDDSGTLLRFLDLYPRIRGGKMSLEQDISPPNHAQRLGRLDIHDFSIVGESALQLVNPAPGEKAGELAVTGLSLSIKQLPDMLAISEGFAYGPSVGATLEGKVDFAGNGLSLRGMLVPHYAPESWMFPPPHQNREGMFALSYEITGPPQAPVMRINTFGPLAPGLLRRLFEFQADDNNRR